MRRAHPSPVAAAALVVAALLAAGALACGSSGTRAPAASKAPAARQLAQLMDRLWEHARAESIYFRLQDGLPIEHLPDLSFAKAEAEATLARKELAELDSLDAMGLSDEEELSRAIVRWQLSDAVEGHEFHWLAFPITPYASPLPIIHRIFTEHRFASAADGQRYLALAAEYPRVIGQISSHFQRQAAMGIRLPAAEIENVLPFLRTLPRPAAQSFFLPAEARLAPLGEPAAGELRAAVTRVIEEQINPALERLIGELAGDYAAKAPKALGLWQYPDGERFYRYLVRHYTTLDLTPEQVHERGKAEVERIERQMALTQRLLGFGEGPRSELHRALAAHPQFVARSADQIGQRLLSYVAKIEPLVPRLFSVTPKAPYTVQRLDPALEGAVTYGYYQPPRAGEARGIYFYNGSQPEKRTLLVAQSLIYHELVPGHHFQIALQNESTALHPLRANFLAASFVEGWAEYASSLGSELGLYDDPYERYGRLAAEMFLATRLVVDTGLHRYQWTREQATEFMSQRTLESKVQIDTEVLRYAADLPGQGLAYKTGAIKIRELRDKAAAALGAAFDVRDFHRAVLGSGAMPLSVLEQHVDWYIDQHRARAAAPSAAAH